MSREYLNISAWHGTTQVIAQKIRREGFKYVEIDFGSQRLRNPNDLGAGVYFFVDSSHELGRVLANNYARTFRNKKAEAQRCSLEVLEATICVKNNMLLDLDATDIMGVFVDFRKKHELEREKIKKKLRNDGAEKRKNYDGIMVELFVRHIDKQNSEGKIQAIQKETYTPFGMTRDISNFPNGKEICVRELECITLKERKEFSNGSEFKKFLRSR